MCAVVVNRMYKVGMALGSLTLPLTYPKVLSLMNTYSLKYKFYHFLERYGGVVSSNLTTYSHNVYR
jgi:hypothetical protein